MGRYIMPIAKSIFLCIMLVFITQSISWAGDVDYLYVIGALGEYDKDFDYKTIYKLKFEHGIYIGFDSLLTTCDEIVGHNKLDSGPINDRFILTSNHCIYDTKLNSIVFFEPDEYSLLGISNDTVYLSRLRRKMDPDRTEPEVYYLDLQGEIKPIPFTDKTSKWYIQCRNWGLLKDLHFSPNEKYFVAAYDFQILKALKIYNIEKDTSRILADSLGSSVACCSPYFRPVIPAYWLDNEHILSQRSNGDLVIIDTSGNVTDFIKIEIDGEPFAMPLFAKNKNGQIVYYCRDMYLLDFNNNSYSRCEWTDLGHGFTTNYREWHKKADTLDIRYEGEIIGRYSEARDWIVSSENYIAIDLEPGSYLIQENGDTRYPWGIFIWNAYTREWSEVKFERIDEIIGWVPAEK